MKRIDNLTKRQHNYILSVVFCAIAIFLWIYGDKTIDTLVGNDSMGAFWWPRVLSILLIILSVSLALMSFLSKKPEMDTEHPILFYSKGLKGVYILILIVAIALALVYTVGYKAMEAVVIISLMLILGERRPWVIGVSTIGMILFVYIMFEKILSLKLP